MFTQETESDLGQDEINKYTTRTLQNQAKCKKCITIIWNQP